MAMYQNMLVVIDPNQDDQPALRRAVYLHQRIGGKIKAFLPIYDFSYEMTTLLSPDERTAMRQGVISQRTAWIHEQAKYYLNAGVPIEIKVVWHNRPFEAIIQEVISGGHDLVLKMAHQHDRLEAVIFTPTDWHLLRKCPSPVWMVKDQPWPEGGKALVAVNLAGLRRDAVVRGDTLCKPDTLRLSRMLDVRLTDLKDSHRIIENGSPVHFYHGAAAHIAKVVLLEQDTLEPGQSGFAQLRFTEPVAVKRGDRFVIRFYSPMETIGGGVILDDCPPRHKRHQPEVIRALTIREGGSAGAQLQQLVEEYGYALPTAQTLAQRQSMPEEEMVQALEDLVNSGDLLEILPRRYLAAPLYRKACRSVEQVLAEYHKANPLHAGMKVAALRQKALRGAELKEADAILTAMLRGGTVTAIADRCALPDFRVVLTKRQTALRQKLLDSYRKSGREVPFVDDIYASFPTNERDDCKKVLENLVSCGELVMLTPQLFYHKDVYEEVCALTRDFFEGHPAFTLAEYRDLLGTSRKYALAILEFFDKTKVTKMVGDHREVIGSL